MTVEVPTATQCMRIWKQRNFVEEFNLIDKAIHPYVCKQFINRRFQVFQC